MTEPELQLLLAYIGTRILLSRITAKYIGGFLTRGRALAPDISRSDTSNKQYERFPPIGFRKLAFSTTLFRKMVGRGGGGLEKIE